MSLSLMCAQFVTRQVLRHVITAHLSLDLNDIDNYSQINHS
ncbi:hypothetical protein BrE312_2279 [Brenneria sp. EniD312]|nr:hypothetical protein BrE312_2279 [Brenneria sp. EniD312]